MKTKLSVFLIVVGLLLVGGTATAMAADHERRKAPPGIQSDPTSRLAPERSSRISNARAASLVKQRHNSARILGVSLLERGGSPVYKVKTLSPNGVVKSVFVDGRTGEIFD